MFVDRRDLMSPYTTWILLVELCSVCFLPAK